MAGRTFTRRCHPQSVRGAGCKGAVTHPGELLGQHRLLTLLLLLLLLYAPLPFPLEGLQLGLQLEQLLQLGLLGDGAAGCGLQSKAASHPPSSTCHFTTPYHPAFDLNAGEEEVSHVALYLRLTQSLALVAT